jgi:kynureninase
MGRETVSLHLERGVGRTECETEAGMNDTTWRNEARAIDAELSAAATRESFLLPTGKAYFLGHSLGPMSRAAREKVELRLHEWKTLAIGGWMDGDGPWFTLAETLASRVAPWVGAKASEVAVTNSLTINLHHVVRSLLQSRPSPVIWSDSLAFPSDRLALEALADSLGGEVKWIPSRDGFTLEDADLETAIATGGDLLWLPSVVYGSGQLLDMARWTREARAKGFLVGWDLAHSFGIRPHTLHDLEVDAAVWCHYKYGCAGPGAVGGLFVHERHRDLKAALAGWFSLAPGERFRPGSTTFAEGAGRFQVGTPPVLSLAAMEGALDLLDSVGPNRMAKESTRLLEFGKRCLGARVPGLEIASPPHHGGHLCLRHPQAAGLSIALRKIGYLLDHRAPDLLRLSLHPLYNRAAEVVDFAEDLGRLLQDFSSDLDETLLVP